MRELQLAVFLREFVASKRIMLKPSGAKLAMFAKDPIAIIVHNALRLFWRRQSFRIKQPGTVTLKILDVIFLINAPRRLNAMVEKGMRHQQSELI